MATNPRIIHLDTADDNMASASVNLSDISSSFSLCFWHLKISLRQKQRVKLFQHKQYFKSVSCGKTTAVGPIQVNARVYRSMGKMLTHISWAFPSAPPKSAMRVFVRAVTTKIISGSLVIISGAAPGCGSYNYVTRNDFVDDFELMRTQTTHLYICLDRSVTKNGCVQTVYDELVVDIAPGEDKARTKSAPKPLQNTLHGKRALCVA